MDIKQLKQALKRYTQTEERYAVMIKGSWGVGKTALWEKVITRWCDIERWQMRVIHVSVFGVTSRAEVTMRLGNARYGDWRFWKSFWSLTGDLVGGALGQGVVSGLGTGISRRLLKKIGANALICIDDFERAAMPHSELLGVLNDLVEYSGAKMVVLADEDKIDKDKDKYKEFKEKVIRYTWNLEYSSEEVIKIIIETVDHDLKFDFESLSSELKLLIEALNCQNLRTLFAGAHTCNYLYSSLNREHKRDQAFLQSLILDVMLKQILFQSPYFSSFKEVHNWRDSVNVWADFFDSDVKQETEKTGKDKFDDGVKKIARAFTATSFTSVSKLVTENIIDQSLIENDYAESKRVDETEWAKFSKTYYLKLEEDALYRSIESIREALKAREVRNTKELDELFRQFELISKDNLITETVADLVTEWLGYISDLDNNKCEIEIFSHSLDALPPLFSTPASAERNEVRAALMRLYENAELRALGHQTEEFWKGVSDTSPERMMYVFKGNHHDSLILNTEITELAVNTYIASSNSRKCELVSMLNSWFQIGYEKIKPEEEAGLRAFDNELKEALEAGELTDKVSIKITEKLIGKIKEYLAWLDKHRSNPEES